ncbi:hypothetical protein EsH8_I_001447 [Colletotrichum jinshuiense]
MSRFVSAGAINAETGEAVAAAAAASGGDDDKRTASGAGEGPSAKKNAEWEIVQRELDAERKRREEARIKSVEGGEKSLYDILEANKAAKQAAFEEANKIKNQFRPLDDDEIDFLDEVRESRRAEEERVRRETEEGLAAFRRAQNQKRPVDEADGGDLAASPSAGETAAVAGGAGTAGGAVAGDEEWAVGPRKRRKKEGRGFGVRREKSDGEKTTTAAAAGEKKVPEEGGEVKVKSAAGVGGGEKEKHKGSPPAPAPAPAPAKGKLGLVAYGSDSDDD